MKKGFLGGVNNLSHGDVACVVPVFYILCYAAVKQHRLLRHDADFRSYERHVDSWRWASINQLKRKHDVTGQDRVSDQSDQVMSRCVHAPPALHLGRRISPAVERWCFCHIRCSPQTPESGRASQTQPGPLTPGRPAVSDR